MYSNISPYVCCNRFEFQEELNHLETVTFKKIKSYYDQYNVNFDPVSISWSENDEVAKNGFLLRLLLHNIENCSPFFICLLGEQYGPYVEDESKIHNNKFLNIQHNSSKKQNEKSTDLNIPTTRRMNWIEKNLIICQKTGYSNIVNSLTQYNSLLDLQVQTAVLNESNPEFFRFYYRQPEYLENKFKDLSNENRKEEMHKYSAENEYCEFKIKDLKTRLVRKGLSIKYYQNIEELDNLIYNDYITIIKKLMNTLKMDRNEIRTEASVLNRLKTYTLTESLSKLEEKVHLFCKFDDKTKKQISFNFSYQDFNELNSNENEKDEYLEILKLRHVNVVNPTPLISTLKSLLLLTGPRGCGKTSFMSYLYEKLKPTEKDSLYLFYFLKSNASIYSILVDIIKQMRLKYHSKDSSKDLNNVFYDKKVLIEQLHASLKLGQVVIFIDGLSELEKQNFIQLDIWLPIQLDNNCKFIFTLNNSSTIYDDMIRSRKSQIIKYDIKTFENDSDYIMFFAKQLKIETSKILLASNKKMFNLPVESFKDQSSQNKLYERAISSIDELKLARHSTNPFFCQIISQELFTFDKDLFDMHPLTISSFNEVRNSIQNDYEMDNLISYHRPSVQRRSSSVMIQNGVNSIFNSYLDEVCTLRELVQKVIKRYIIKYSWNNDETTQVSIENPGWIGDILCFISLSLNGVTKESIMNLLRMKGYINDFQVKESDWYTFRFLFGSFIYESLNGLIVFSHDYYKEAVQSLLLEGFFVELNVDQVDNARSLVLIPKKNLSQKQLEIHMYITIDLLTNKITKNDFNNSSCICPNKNYDDLSSRYYEYICEILYNLHMLYDLPSMNKILTNYKVLEIINKNRIKNINLWFKYLEFFKTLKPLKFFELSLLNNLTYDLPHVIHLAETLKTSTIDNSSDIEASNSIIAIESSEYVTNKYLDNLNESIQLENLEDDSLLLENYTSVKTQTLSKESDSLYNYQTLIDNLIDYKYRYSNDKNNKSEKEHINLVLLNRVLLLNDLMINLDERNFIKNYSTKLYELVNKIIQKNYPLSDNEKYFYTKLLDHLSVYHMKNNEYESSLTCIMRSIEIVEDLYHTFEFSNLSQKFKTKKGFYELSNFLSLQYSFMAYILLKINDVNSAQLLLSKANDYNKENTDYLIKLKKKNEHTEDASKNKVLNFNENDADDSSFYTAKYFVYLNSALLESQLNSHKRANQLFLKALNLSIRWFGENHSYTSKAYHYYGCYLALKQSEYFNPKKSELYLRKALAICEKYKNVILVPHDKNEVHDSNLIDRRFQSALTKSDGHLQQNTDILYDNNLKSHFNDEKLDGEELNSISTILYDLACLLSVNKTEILRKEGIDCLRRCLDIKVLMYGANHIECQLIKNQLTNFEIKNTTFTNETNAQGKKNNNQLKPILVQRSNTFVNLTPRDKTLRSLEHLRKEMRNDKINSIMLDWISRNSLIETIKPIEKTHLNDLSHIQASENNNISSSRLVAVNSRSKSRLLSSRIPTSFSVSGQRQDVKTPHTPHQQACYIPTAFSVDIHNSNSVHGPHSSIREILTDSLKDKKVHKPHTAILKPIYYKSAWYDRPYGSSKKRFKNYQKLIPNNSLNIFKTNTETSLSNII